MDSPFDKEYFTLGTTGYKGYTDFVINEYKVEKILRYKPRNVLDVGCAHGFIVKRLNNAGVDAHGVDISSYAVAKRADPHVTKGSVLDLPYDDEQFDFIFSSDMLEHIAEEDIPTAIDELCRVGDRGLLEITYEKTPMDIDETHVTMHPYEWWRERIPKQFDLSPPDEYALKLNIGCFTSFFMFHDIWVNIDKLDLAPIMQSRCRFVQHDVMTGIPYPDGGAAMIYTSDFFEHLSYHEAIAFLKECRRVLKPGGLLRVCVPNLDILLDYHASHRLDSLNHIQPKEYAEVTAESIKLSMLMFGSLGSSQSAYRGHQMMYDFDGLEEMLLRSGFTDIHQKFEDDSASPYMCRKDVHRKLELAVEGIK